MAELILGSVPTYQGEYKEGRTYYRDNVVASNGNAYISLIDDNTRPLTDSSAWDVFTQGLNGIFVEAAAGKQKLISKIAQKGGSVDSESTYDEMVEEVENLYSTSGRDFWQALGYTSEADFGDGLAAGVANLAKRMNDELQRVRNEEITIAEWCKSYELDVDCQYISFCPKLDTSGIGEFTEMFCGFCALITIPALDTSNAISMDAMFDNCSSLITIPALYHRDMCTMNWMFNCCYCLTTIPALDVSYLESIYAAFSNCYALVTCNISNLMCDLSISDSPLLSAESVAFIVSHAANTSEITITLHSEAYAVAIADAAVQAALEAHPLVTLASA